MNEISSTADEGDMERCEDCGKFFTSNLLGPVMTKQGGCDIELIICWRCKLENGYVRL